MDWINTWLVQRWSLPVDATSTLVFAVRVVAEIPLLVVPLGLVCAWLIGGHKRRVALVHATVGALMALAMAQAMSHLWPHPRPFALGLTPVWTQHAKDPSFPSDHLTLLWSVSLGLWWHPPTRRWGVALALLGLPVAWARVALGLHFPLDMLGACVASALTVGALGLGTPVILHAITRHLINLYRILAGPLIRRQWLRP